MLDLIGHREAVDLLRRGLAGGRLSHAYLITGPRGVGRRTLALELAKALNCEADSAERPCHRCRPCRLIERGVYPDVRVVKRAPERRSILLRATGPATADRAYADNVEFIQSDAQLRPVDGRKKVYLILNAEELSAEAANRLLKSIEEPTTYVHFVLTAGDRGSVLPTIVSRCQEIRLRPVPRAEIVDQLVARGLADHAGAQTLAALSGGAPGWALAGARDASLLEVHRADVRDLRAALAASRVDRLILARQMAERWGGQPEALRTTLRAWLAWWRDVLLVQQGLEDRVAHGEAAERVALRQAAAAMETREAQAAQERVRRTLADLEANVNARLALDLLLLRLPTVPARAA